MKMHCRKRRFAKVPNSLSDVRQVINHDLPASLVTFLVALPLSLGIALASGAPLMAGIIAAVIGGVVVGTLGGAPMQVSGPAAGLTVIVFGLVQQYGWETTCAITVCAGILQIVLGLIGIAPVAMAISPAVLHGMLAAIGILIALSQIHVVLGHHPVGGGIANLFAIPSSVFNAHPAAAFLGLMTIAILALWPKLSFRLTRNIPAALAAVVTATALSVILRLDVPRVQLSGSLFSSFTLPVFPVGNYLPFVGGVLVLTLVASAESLLCAVATEKLHSGPRCCLHKELIGQGAGNALSGLLGGLPVTGVIVRSKVSIAAGAKTRASAILHGLWVLVFVALLPGLIMSIPLAVLAGLLVYTGIQLVNLHHVSELRKYQETLVYAVTVAGIVGINLLAGLGIGFATALLRLLWKLTHLDVGVEERGNRWHVKISGTLTFAGIPKLTKRLAVIPPGSEVEVNLALRYLDHAGCEALRSWQENFEKFGGHVFTTAFSESWHSCSGLGNPSLVDCSVFENVWAHNNCSPDKAPLSAKQDA
jgi:carbonic anhydrase